MALEVDRADLRRTRMTDDDVPVVAEGQALLRIESFGLSANNVTYAVMGEQMRYWQFFPPASPADAATWGRVPVWGFAHVADSTVPGVEEGRRVFGYLPAADWLVVEPGRIDEGRLVDISAHRADLPSAYNGYRFTDADPIWRADREAHQIIFVPLFFTSWVIDDFLEDNEMFGAGTVVVSSASSKTSIGVAHLVASKRAARVVGLTSPGNLAFTRSLGCYDEVLTYDDVESLDHDPTAFVDVAGNLDVRAAVHHHYGDRLRHSMQVGDTHWDHVPGQRGPLPGPAPQFLFAPNQFRKRADDWGRRGLDDRIAASWNGLCEFLDTWIRYEETCGGPEVEALFRSLVDGQVDPSVGHVCRLGRT